MGVSMWQSIDTAPKDGTEILVFDRTTKGNSNMRVSYWYADNHGRGFYTRGSQFLDKCQPTHWMPLPSPPP